MQKGNRFECLTYFELVTTFALYFSVFWGDPASRCRQAPWRERSGDIGFVLFDPGRGEPPGNRSELH